MIHKFLAISPPPATKIKGEAESDTESAIKLLKKLNKRATAGLER